MPRAPFPTTIRGMGFNRRKMEAERKAKADAEAAARRATDAQVLQDAERLIGAWNERQARRMPLLFAPTIGARRPRPLCLDPRLDPHRYARVGLVCTRWTEGP